MSPEEIKAKIKDIITNQIRAAEDPSAADQISVDIHDILTAKMREKVLGKTETEDLEDDDIDPDLEDE